MTCVSQKLGEQHGFGHALGGRGIRCAGAQGLERQMCLKRKLIRDGAQNWQQLCFGDLDARRLARAFEKESA